MKFKLEMNIDNADFEEDLVAGIKRVLGTLDIDALTITHGAMYVRDGNGNTIGSMIIKGSKKP